MVMVGAALDGALSLVSSSALALRAATAAYDGEFGLEGDEGRAVAVVLAVVDTRGGVFEEATRESAAGGEEDGAVKDVAADVTVRALLLSVLAGKGARVAEEVAEGAGVSVVNGVSDAGGEIVASVVEEALIGASLEPNEEVDVEVNADVDTEVLIEAGEEDADAEKTAVEELATIAPEADVKIDAVDIADARAGVAAIEEGEDAAIAVEELTVTGATLELLSVRRSKDSSFVLAERAALIGRAAVMFEVVRVSLI